MASGPWDNVQLPGPPNGPAWIQAAAQMMGAVNNDVSGLGTAYQQGQQFNQQQRQANFFQNPQNQQLLSTFLQNPTQQNYAALLTPMVQAGGMQAAGPAIDQYLGISQDANIAKMIGGGGQPQQPVSAGPDTSTHAASDKNIIPNNGPRIGYGTGEQPNLNTIAGKVGANVPDQVLQRIATSVGASSAEDDLTPDQAARAQVRLDQYLKRNGGNANPVAQSGNGDQEAASSNQLNPSTGQGSPAMTPRQTGERRTAQAATVPTEGTFNDRFAPTGVTRAGAETVAQTGGTRASPLGDTAKLDAMNARIQQLRSIEAASARRSPKASEAAGKAADDLVKERDKLAESLSKYNEPTPTMKEAEASGAKSPLEYKSAEERNKLKAQEYGKQYLSIQATDRAAADSDEDMRAMRGILNDPKLFSMAGNEAVTYMRGALINAGLMDPNARLPNEALKKITSRALQAQMDEMKDNAAAIGGGAGRVMLAQVNIMKDASQNIEMSPSGLRYLTELMERANSRSHAIAQMARDYNRQNGGRGLDEGFDQALANYSRKNPLMTDQEIEHHKLLSSPHLPASLQRAEVADVARWAHQQGVKRGEPIRLNDDFPAVYKPAP